MTVQKIGAKYQPFPWQNSKICIYDSSIIIISRTSILTVLYYVIISPVAQAEVYTFTNITTYIDRSVELISIIKLQTSIDKIRDSIIYQSSYKVQITF